MLITVSAGRHGLADAAIVHAVGNAIRVIEIDDGIFVIGPDGAGRLLELLAHADESGELIVFHAMPLRRVNAERYL